MSKDKKLKIIGKCKKCGTEFGIPPFDENCGKNKKSKDDEEFTNIQQVVDKFFPKSGDKVMVLSKEERDLINERRKHGGYESND